MVLRYVARSIIDAAVPFCLVWAGLSAGSGRAIAQLQFESEPINYASAETDNPVARLQERLDAGEAQLAYDDQYGYLPAVLESLEVQPSSQVLVFSQTSFQLRKISPQRPRAVYFNDDTYVGWVQRGDVLEIATIDPQLGTIFYTLDQQRSERTNFVRDRGQCLTCHASSRTQGVPGLLIRSVFPDASGRPILGSGTFTTDHRSPFRERWGGWYVTGTHGEMRHMGNGTVADRSNPEALDLEAGANRGDLKDLCDTASYLKPRSDLVALMVLEHQSQMHNFLTLANFETRLALHYDGIMNEALGRPADHQSESTQRRIAAVAEKLVRYLLFVDEFVLTAPVRGSEEFISQFVSQGLRDGQGRSLRELDLNHRLLKYPCSYLIYSEAFTQLPVQVRQPVYRQLFEVLSGHDPSEEFGRFSPKDRGAIREILCDTKPDLRVAFEAFAAS
jgi:hypothetical protein